jgi:hypothetical protein
MNLNHGKSGHPEEILEIDFDYVMTMCDNTADNRPASTGKAAVRQSPCEYVRSAADEEEKYRDFQ